MRRPDLPTRRALSLGLPLLPALGALGGALGPLLAPRRRGQSGLSTVVLLRHAEKDPSSDPLDPGLSEAGERRARALSILLARAHVSHLFSSEFKRARETLAPLSKAARLEVEVFAAAKSADLAARIEALPAGSVSVVAGHSNTIPGIAAALGGEIADLESTPNGRALNEKDFGRLFVVTLEEAPARAAGEARRSALLELAYGD